MIGIVIPAHNEEQHLGNCLAVIQQAIGQFSSYAIPVQVLVVLDSCNDRSLEVVRCAQVEYLPRVDYLQCKVRCVGKARDLGIRHLIDQGASWLACTDADSQVAPDWLVQQWRHQPTDVICGVVEVQDWQQLSAQTRQDYLAHYQDTMNHQHIHGANLSFSASAYLQVGGFPLLPCHEDVELVNRMLAQQLHVVRSNKVRVATSCRLQARAPEGFAAFLQNLEKRPEKNATSQALR